jgi:hypothetical protein
VLGRGDHAEPLLPHHKRPRLAAAAAMGLPADAASAASGTGLATVLLDETTDQATPMLTSVMSAYGCGPLRGYELDKQLRCALTR